MPMTVGCVLSPSAPIASSSLVAATTTWCASGTPPMEDRKSTRLNSSHLVISYAVFCLKKKNKRNLPHRLVERLEVFLNTCLRAVVVITLQDVSCVRSASASVKTPLEHYCPTRASQTIA